MIHSKLLRVLLPAIIILIWFGLAGVGGPTFGKLGGVSTNDQAAFLPASAESTKVQQIQSKFTEGDSIPAIVLIESDTRFSREQFSYFKDLGTQLAEVDGITTGNDGKAVVVGPIPATDGKAVQYIVPIDDAAEPKDVVTELRTTINKDLPSGLTAYVAGPAGLIADLAEAFGGIDGILLLVALSAVCIILLVVYRSLLLPLIVLINAMFALCGAIVLVYLLAKYGVIKLNGQSQGILSILVIGAATDYSLLLVSRYKEALHKTSSKFEAIWAGIRGSFEPILASAATVIIALLCLLFSDLNSNRSLGPIAAIGIAASFLASMTLLPALLVAFGKTAFWPSQIKQDATAKPTPIKTGLEELSGFWKRTGQLIANRRRTVWIVITIVLALCCLGLFQLKASGVPQTELILSESNAVDGQKAIARHFDAGVGAPVVIVAPESAADDVQQALASNANLSDIVYAADTARNPSGRAAAQSQAKVIDGNVLLYATLDAEPYSDEAQTIISDLRSQLAAVNGSALVGGTTAVTLDTNTTAEHDVRKIVPIVLVMILLILIILLRAFIAPLILILTVILSFGATMGISALVFNHIFHFPGADPVVPLFGFVFLVALGVDYNIFLITRTREEALKYGTRPAMLHSLGKTGGVITSAGIVLAATFAALGIIPILFLAQLAFIVAFGVLLDTLIVRSLLVPALIYELNEKSWWPSRKLMQKR